MFSSSQHINARLVLILTMCHIPFGQGHAVDALRNSFAVGLLVEDGVNLEELETLISGGSVTGFSVLRCGAY